MENVAQTREVKLRELLWRQLQEPNEMRGSKKRGGHLMLLNEATEFAGIPLGHQHHGAASKQRQVCVSLWATVIERTSYKVNVRLRVTPHLRHHVLRIGQHLGAC